MRHAEVGLPRHSPSCPHLLIGTLCASRLEFFRGNAAMTGAVPRTLPHPLEERWQFRTGDAIEGAPAIVGQQVFVASLDKHVYALELATGKLLWKAAWDRSRLPRPSTRVRF
jgi:hypothetical protein